MSTPRNHSLSELCEPSCRPITPLRTRKRTFAATSETSLPNPPFMAAEKNKKRESKRSSWLVADSVSTSIQRTSHWYLSRPPSALQILAPSCSEPCCRCCCCRCLWWFRHLSPMQETTEASAWSSFLRISFPVPRSPPLETACLCPVHPARRRQNAQTSSFSRHLDVPSQDPLPLVVPPTKSKNNPQSAHCVVCGCR
ncbi:hypothetical protein CSHISOI_05466 [Colletotrichum shisoi]|uniref:Uncharacterized protein n=1 Tax=Colletotrichum shisoi TaxID=2078593 RepID=A0A5Q4BJ38_9PEZI|nr:hypothetical protein CSHISOI_05466 [Colletotrichum shisoi]